MSEWIKYDGTNKPDDDVECFVEDEFGPSSSSQYSQDWVWDRVERFMVVPQ